MKSFKPKYFIECQKCFDVVCSLWEGYYVCCSCEATAIDETIYYCRVLSDDYKEVKATQLHKDLYWLLLKNMEL